MLNMLNFFHSFNKKSGPDAVTAYSNTYQVV